MNFVDLVALLALLQLMGFSVLVGHARGKYLVKAPAVAGNEMFERAYRVQMNTLELVVAFLPSLYLAAKYWSASYASIVGAVYLVGRLIYWQAYLRSPESRGFGFLLSIGPVFALLLASLVSILRSY